MEKATVQSAKLTETQVRRMKREELIKLANKLEIHITQSDSVRRLKNVITEHLFADEDEKEVEVPKERRAELMRLAHEVWFAGHLSGTEIYERIASSFYWPDMYKDIDEYIKGCHICQVKRREKEERELAREKKERELAKEKEERELAAQERREKEERELAREKEEN